MGGSVSQGQTFSWRFGRAEVTLGRVGDAWIVVYTRSGRLLGPRLTIYEAKHVQANLAAWDVMARVIRASRDEDEGLRVARSAAQWMRTIELPNEREEVGHLME